MRISIVFIIFSIYVGGCSYVNEKLNVDDDGVVEELIEVLIEKETGLNIDLTPKSRE